MNLFTHFHFLEHEFSILFSSCIKHRRRLGAYVSAVLTDVFCTPSCKCLTHLSSTFSVDVLQIIFLAVLLFHFVVYYCSKRSSYCLTVCGLITHCMISVICDLLDVVSLLLSICWLKIYNQLNTLFKIMEAKCCRGFTSSAALCENCRVSHNYNIAQ